ncbi:MAG: hypothetical protein OXC31_16450 [Spirochaetaceae bacterium]|nr:hypothetical protein [Spirochaetaceae bacterium]
MAELPRANEPCSTYASSRSASTVIVAWRGSAIQYSEDSRFGVVGAFLYQIPVRIIRADDLDHQVGTQPETVLEAGILAAQEQQQVGLAKLARAYPQAQGGERHDAALRHDVIVEQAEEEREDKLVDGGRLGQLLDATVGELNQAVRVVGEPQVRLVAPGTLRGQDIRAAGWPARPARSAQLVRTRPPCLRCSKPDSYSVARGVNRRSVGQKQGVEAEREVR